MNKIILFAVFVAFIGVPMSSHAMTTTDEWGKLNKIPEDSVQQKNLRVWLAQEQIAPCTLLVDIYNDQDSLVRHFLEMSIRPGYFNIYWDKKDDNDNYVPEGNYTYKVNDCGGNRTGKLTVQYKKWERDSFCRFTDSFQPLIVFFGLLEDSAVVNLEIYNYRGILIKTPIKDALLSKGEFRFEFNFGDKLGRIISTAILYIDDFIYKKVLKTKNELLNKRNQKIPSKVHPRKKRLRSKENNSGD